MLRPPVFSLYPEYTAFTSTTSLDKKDLRHPLLVEERKRSEISNGCNEPNTDVVRLKTKVIV